MGQFSSAIRCLVLASSRPLSGNKLALIKPTIDRWSSSTHRTRHREVVLARLRIGHTRLTHGHLMSHSDPPRCPSCHVPLSVVHFLIDCPRYASLRRSVFPTLLSHHPYRRLSFSLCPHHSIPDVVLPFMLPVTRPSDPRRYCTTWTASRVTLLNK